jgi:ubiquinone/menaquinone biosynthesis C-methylase UbiE
MTSRGDSPSDRARAVAKEFDRAAPGYEEGRLASWYQAQGRMVLEVMGPLHRGLVVDIGCGTGWLLRELLRDRPSLRGLGIDVSEEMVEAAKRKASAESIRNVEFRRGDWERAMLPNLGLAGERAKLVTCVSAFHYFQDPLGALKRIRRILAPGGRILLLDRDRSGAPMTASWDLLHRYLIRDNCRFYGAEELSALLKRAGFAKPRIESRVRRFFWHGKAWSSLVVLSASNSGGAEGASRSYRKAGGGKA